METARSPHGVPSGDGAGGRTPHSLSELTTMHDPPAWEEYKLYRIGTMLARKVGETHKRCPREEIYMTHHILQLENGQRIEVSWKQFLEWAVQEVAEKVHLVSEEAIQHAEDAEEGTLGWTDALRKIRALQPLCERETTLNAEVVSS